MLASPSSPDHASGGGGDLANQAVQPLYDGPRLRILDNYLGMSYINFQEV
jgi:hypothetical protein